MTNKFGLEIEFVGLGDRVGEIADKISEQINDHNIVIRGESYNHSRRSFWKVTTDSSVFMNHNPYRNLQEAYESLTCDCRDCRDNMRAAFESNDFRQNGAELVSPVLDFNEDSFSKIQCILDTLKNLGASANDTCGVHVHIDCNWLNLLPPQKRNEFFSMMFKQYQQHEAKFDSFVSQNRRNNENRYCRSLRNISEQNMFSDRYRKLNFQSFERHGTVEFRQLQGTLNPNVIIAWIKLCQAFTVNIRNQVVVNARQAAPVNHTLYI